MKQIVFFGLFLLIMSNVLALSPEESAVLVTATVQDNPPQITLSWKPFTGDGSYRIYKHSNGPDSNWGSAISTLPNTATQYIDTDVQEGVVYEYHIARGNEGDGYIASGINVPMIDHRGTLLFVVDNTFTVSLMAELRLMQKMMLADGWDVVRIDVDRNATVTSVKALIESAYFEDPENVKAVYLFGHVPVPYSGNIVPDGHDGSRGNSHRGAWAADVFYGDINNSWSDNSVNVSISNFAHNYNVLGDGKYDQSCLSEKIELQVGRVDLQDMTWFNQSEEALLKQYVMKDYEFRYKIYVPQQRAIVYSGFGKHNGMYPAKSAYRNAANFVGYENIKTITTDWTILPGMKNESYLFAHGDGSGWMQGSSGFGMTDEFAAYDPKCTFWSSFGSWYGDWDYQNSYLRAPLATSRGLFNAWVGTTHWFLHHFAMGYNIGYSVNLWHNNQQGNLLYPLNSKNNLTQNVETALMGDPTLRLQPVAPPANVINTDGVITWEASADASVLGYHVYKASSELGVYKRLTTELADALNFTDVNYTPGEVYMVRAVKLEVSKCGSYYNPSQGMFSTCLIDSISPTMVQNIVVSSQTDNGGVLTWTASTDNVDVVAYRVYDGAELIGESSNNTITLTGLLPGTSYDQMVVVAVDPSGNESVPANTGTWMTSGPADTEAPGIPSGLTVEASNTTSVAISWAASIDNVGVKFYAVYLNGTLYELVADTSLTIKGLVNNTAYSIDIAAVDDSRNSSVRSNPLRFITNNMPYSYVPAAYMAASPQIDGEVDALWESIDNVVLQNSKGEVTDVNDIYATYKVGWDERNLYFLVEARDDEFMNHAGSFIKNDNVELYFDMGNKHDGSSSVASSGDNMQLRFVPLFQYMNLDKTGVNWQAINFRSVADDGYWAIEAAIPWSFLGGNIVIAEGLKIGFEVKVADYDRDGSTGELFWSTVTKEPETDDSEFGELELLRGAALDITLPSAPGNLKISNEQEEAFTLSWDSGADNVGIANYRVYQGTTLISTQITTTIDISGLTAGNVTGFYVVAVDLNGNNSVASPMLYYGNTSGDNLSPTPPSGIRATNMNDTSMQIHWTASTDNVEVTGYHININGVFYASETSTSVILNGLSPSADYLIQIQAFDASGNLSPWSNLDVQTIASPDLEAPSIPNNLRVTKTNSRGIILEWDAATDNIGVTVYVIYLDSVHLLKTVTGTTTIITTLVDGVNYKISVSAKDASGNESAQSAMISVLPTKTSQYNSLQTLIYPNPATDSVTIVVEQAVSLNIFSSTGVLLGTRNLDKGENKIDLRLASGVYFLTYLNQGSLITDTLIVE